MRLLTPEAARAILARETSEAFLALMQITGPGLKAATYSKGRHLP